MLSLMLEDPRLSQRVEGMDDEIGRYFERVVEAGRRAHEHLVEANLRLVVSVARKYQNRGMALLDLNPGGQPGIDPGRGEVRSPAGVQVQHLRHLVDPAGGEPRRG